MLGKFRRVHKVRNRFENPSRITIILLASCVSHRGLRIIINTCQSGIFIAHFYLIYIAAKLGFQLFISETDCLLIIIVRIKRLITACKTFSPADVLLCHQFAEICLGTFRVDIKHLFAVFIRFLPVSILQKHKYSLEKRCGISASRINHQCFLDSGFLLVCSYYFLDAADKVLHKAEFAHVLRLQMRKFFRQVIGVHIFICRNKYLLAARIFDKRKIAAPFISDPHGIEIFRSCAEYHHYFCAVQCRKYVRFISCTEFILECNTAEKDLETFLRQLMI